MQTITVALGRSAASMPAMGERCPSNAHCLQAWLPGRQQRCPMERRCTLSARHVHMHLPRRRAANC